MQSVKVPPVSMKTSHGLPPRTASEPASIRESGVARGLIACLQLANRLSSAEPAIRSNLERCMRVSPFHMIFAVCFVALGLAIVASSGCSERGEMAPPVPTATVPPPSDPVGRGMFGIPLLTLDGAEATLSAYEGRPMLIEVWATWCGPCRKVRSVIKEHRAALAEVATVVGVSVDQGGGPVVKAYLQKTPTPGMLEYLVTNRFRAAIAPLDTQNTIPKLIYVRPDGRIANLSYGVNSPSFMIGLLRNLGREDGR